MTTITRKTIKPNKKPLIIAIILIVAAVIGCIAFSMLNKTEKSLKLSIKESSWSGLGEPYVSEETAHNYDNLKLDEKYTVKTRTYSVGTSREKLQEDVLAFTITEIKDDSIKIKTTKTFWSREDGDSSNKEGTAFEIFLNKELRLDTPTMDAGDIFVFLLTK